MSKGSNRRPCNEKKVADNWPFRKPKLNVWKRNKDGKLIK